MKKFYPQKKFYIPTLVIGNNTGATVPIQVFNRNNPGDASSFNARKQYRWDLTGTNYANAVSVSIQAKVPGGTMQTLTVNMSVSDVAGVVAILNGLNIGIFYSQVIGSSTFISTWSDRIVYGNLVINGAANSVQWIYNGVFQVNNLNCIGFETGVNDLRSIFLLSSNTFNLLPTPVTQPFNNNITYSTTILANGDQLQFGVNWTIFPVIASAMTIVLKQDGIIILNQTVNSVVANNTVNFLFNYNFNSVYTATITIN